MPNLTISPHWQAGWLLTLTSQGGIHMNLAYIYIHGNITIHFIIYHQVCIPIILYVYTLYYTKNI